MGNNNSTRNIKQDTGQQNALLQYFTNTNTQKSNVDPYAKANELYHKFNQNNTGNELYIERCVELFTHPSGTFPYYSDHKFPEYDSLSSEGPRFVELIICTDQGDIREKFAVHHNKPDHDCGPNCQCIEEIFEVSDKKTSIFSPTSSEGTKTQTIFSATSSEPPVPAQTGGCPFCMRSTKDRMEGGVCSGLRNDNMVGGENNETSPDELTDSEDEIDEAYSETSDMSDTMTSPEDDIEPKTRKKKLENMEEEEEEDEEDIEGYEDEILEGIDDEEITEDGFILEQSDISSSDLYRMQSRIFRSNTESVRSKDEEDEETTEKVRRAMNQIDRRGMFDSEDRDILFNASSSEDFTRRPTRSNPKYR